MHFTVQPTASGFTLALSGEHYQAEPCEFRYPEAVWQAYPAKDALIRELAYITTQAAPLILQHPRVHYDTPPPCHLDTYLQLYERAIPNLVEAVPAESSAEIQARLRGLHYRFAPEAASAALPVQPWHPRRAVLPLSFGKDSLLSLATLLHLGYEVYPVSIDERVLPRANALHRQYIEQLYSEFGLHCDIVENEVQLLSDYQILERPETRLYQVQVHFIYALAMLPFCAYYGAPTIVLSNELPNALPMRHREGYLAPKRYMQAPQANHTMDRLVNELSGGQVRVANPIGALGNLAIYRLLHQHWPQFGRFQTSCHLEVTEHPRWCHGCERCTHGYLYLRALGLDPVDYGFEHSLLDGRNDHHFVITGNEPPDEDIYRLFVREEEWLAAQLARSHGTEVPDWALEDLTMEGASERIFGLHLPPRHDLEAEAHDLYRSLLAGAVSAKTKPAA